MTSAAVDPPVMLVTGAARGIGRATAELLAARGSVVMLVDTDEEGASAVAGSLSARGQVARGFGGDVADPEAVTDVARQVLEAYGHIDGLVNNAGTIAKSDDVVGQSWDDWRRIMEVNAGGAFLWTKAVVPSMLQRKRGSIVNVASISALVGLPHQSAYCMSKGAVVQLTRQVAVEYAARGIRCNAVCPGSVDTELFRRAVGEQDDAEAAQRAFRSAHPIGRLGEPVEVANAIAYLLSDEASFATGAILSVDGGFVAQ